ncbi:protein transport protein S31 [Irineochytrium annulatum]|nr:protein transport protein S31 [Irineochytrium annulatum]
MLATGTVAGALDASFSTNAELEIFDLNLSAGSNQAPRRLGVVSGSARFNRLAWGTSPDPKRSYGFLAGGMENGEMDLWDPQLIIDGSGSDPLITRQSRHSGPVRGLDFNPVDPKFLASGATDGEIFIWDLGNPTKPYSPGTRSQKLEDVTALSWNRQVFYILASASNNGNTVIWDLRNKKEILGLTHPGGRKMITGVSWHPDSATQIVTVADDDNSPVLLMWDLRNARAPERALSGHTRGILSVSWCPKDSDLILSCGKDNRTIVWNSVTGEAVGDLEVSHNWAFDAQWCLRNPDLACVASFDGKVSVHSLQSSAKDSSEPAAAHVSTADNPFGFVDNNAQAPASSFSLKQPPKWLRRPVGCAWGFGGRLVTFSQQGGSTAPKTVTVHTVVTEPAFVSRVRELNRVRVEASVEEYMKFCQTMAKMEGAIITDKDKEVWNFIKLMFEPGALEQIVEFLGFDKSDVGGPRLAGLLQKLKLTTEASLTEPEPAAAGSNNVFDDITALEAKKAGPFALYSGSKGEEHDIDSLVMKSLILGNFESAVRVCFGANRLSDALMLALCGGPDLLSFAQREYFKRARDEKSYIRVLQSVLAGDLRDVVENAQLDGTEGNWKDILALICTYAKPEDLAELFSTLGRRLESSAGGASSATRDDRKFAAVLCFLGAGDIVKVVDVWTIKESLDEKILASKKDVSVRAPHALALQGLMEKVLVFRKAINFVDPDMSASEETYKYEPLYKHFVDYANCLADQGAVEIAWSILELIPDGFSLTSADGSDPVAIIKDRVYKRGGVRGKAAPKLPFEQVLVYGPQSVQQPAAQAFPSMAATSSNSYNSYAPGGYGQSANGYYGSTQQQWQPQPPVPPPSNAYAAVPPPMNAYGGSAPPLNAYGSSAAAPTNAYGGMPPTNQYGGTSGANAYGGPPAPVRGSSNSSKFVPPPPPQYTSGGSYSTGTQPSSGYQPAPPSAGFAPPPPNTFATAGSWNNSTNPTAIPPPPMKATSSASGITADVKPWNDVPDNLLSGSRAAKAPNTIASPFPNAQPGYGANPAAGGPSPAFGGPPQGHVAPPPGAGFVNQPPAAYGQPPASSFAAAAAASYNGPPSAGVVSPNAGFGGPAGNYNGGMMRTGSTPAQELATSPQPVEVKPPQPPPPSRHPFGDRSHIPPQHQPLVSGLDALMTATKAVVTNPQKKRELDDTEKKISILVDQLNNGEVQEDVILKLSELIKATQSRDYGTAQRIQVDLMTTRYNVTSAWIVGVKRAITALEQAHAYQQQQQQYQQQHQQQFAAGPPRPY